MTKYQEAAGKDGTDGKRFSSTTAAIYIISESKRGLNKQFDTLHSHHLLHGDKATFQPAPGLDTCKRLRLA